jgi:hypothetical protein
MFAAPERDSDVQPDDTESSGTYPRAHGPAYPPEYFMPTRCISCHREMIQPALIASRYPPICIWCWAK